MENDLASQYRHLFPVLENVTYLNSCSQGAIAIPVREALNHYLDGLYAKGALWDQWVLKQEELRELVAQVFKTDSKNVAITASASSGINSIVSALDFSGERNRIVTTDLEFPTMGQILHAQKRYGAEVIHVKSEPDGTLDLTKFMKVLDERVALVAVTHLSYRNGALVDIKKIADESHKYQIPVLIDASQTVGSFAIEFERSGADFMVGSFLKYMLGIPGVAFLLARHSEDYVPTRTGWFAARDVFAMNAQSYEPARNARRFQDGTPPVPSIYGSSAGLKLLLDVGLENIGRHNQDLQKLVRNQLKELELVVSTPRECGSMVAFQSNNEQFVVSELEKRGLIVSSREKNVRISLHFYNNSEDAEFLAASLESMRSII